MNLAQTREPYERFDKFHASIDRYASMQLENDEYNSYSLTVAIAGGEEITVPISASQILFHLDRTAYIEALRAGQEADQNLFDDISAVGLPPLEGQVA